MTGEFDMLMSICYFARQDPRLKPLAEWLADRCIAETRGKKKGWDFESWKEKWGELYEPDDLKWQYLDECHDVLDHHGGFHGKVFKPSTVALIQFVHTFVVSKEGVSKYMLKRQLGKKMADELLQMIRSSGVEIEEDKYFIRRKRGG